MHLLEIYRVQRAMKLRRYLLGIFDTDNCSAVAIYDPPWTPENDRKKVFRATRYPRHRIAMTRAVKLCLKRDRRAAHAAHVDASGAAREVYRRNSRENVYGTLDAANNTIPHAI